MPLVYAVAILEALGYFSAVPVCVAFCVSGRDGLKAGAAVGAFSAGAAFRRAMAHMRRETPKKRRGRPPVKRLIKLARHLRVERFSLRGRLGLSDAAATALLCGAISALGASLRGRVDSLAVDVAPAFDGPRAELRGIVRVRLGQIILAAARSNLD